jgi:catechol 2,3-dioxygenase-like lactoylglutathione lyase family enzyme
MAITDSPIHATLAVSDLARSKAWYEQKFGWVPVVELPDPAIYRVGDSYFTLFTTENAGTAKNTVMNWNVADLPAEVRRLRERGVMFEDYDFGDIRTVDGIMTDPTGGMTAWFKDPDGNTIGVLQAPEGVGTGNALSVMLAASDMARAKAWYSEKLGFDPVAEFEGFVMDYTSAGSSFNVYKTEFAGSAKNTVALWRMPNIRAEVERLRGRGVVFEEYDFGEDGRTVDGILTTEEEGDETAWFLDSEGNVLSLAEDRGELPFD